MIHFISQYLGYILGGAWVVFVVCLYIKDPGFFTDTESDD